MVSGSVGPCRPCRSPTSSPRSAPPGASSPRTRRALLVEAAAARPNSSAMVERRVAGEPLEHVLGWAEFCGLRIAVDPGRLRAPPPHRAARRQAGRPGSGRAPWWSTCAAAPGRSATALAAGVPAARAARRRRRPGGGRAAPGATSSAATSTRATCTSRCRPSLRGRVDVVRGQRAVRPDRGDRADAARGARARAGRGAGRRRRRARRPTAGRGAAPRWLAPGGHLLIETSVRQAPLTAAAVAAAGLVTRVERDDERDGTAVVGIRAC